MKKKKRTRRRNSRFKLKDMIAAIKPGNVPPLYDWGPDVGTEIIPPWDSNNNCPEDPTAR
jgi:hypothetical protein